MAIDFNKLKQKAAQISQEKNKSGKSTIDYMKLKVGKNNIRLMPEWTNEGPNANQFYRELFTHWNVGGDGSDGSPGITFLCPRLTLGAVSKECPVCEEMFRLYKTKDPLDAEKAKALKARKGYLSNVVDLDDASFTLEDFKKFKEGNPDKDPHFAVGDTKVKVLNYGVTLFSEIFDYFVDGEIDLTDLDTGRNIVIKRVGTGRQDTEYTLRVDMAESPFKFKGDLKKSLYNLDTIKPFLDFDKMKEALQLGGNSSPLALTDSVPF